MKQMTLKGARELETGNELRSKSEPWEAKLFIYGYAFATAKMSSLRHGDAKRSV